MEKPTPPLNCIQKPQWMLDMSLRLIGSREDQRRQPYHNRNMAQTLTKSVRKYLYVDTCRRSEVAAEKIGAYLEKPTRTPPYLQRD